MAKIGEEDEKELQVGWHDKRECDKIMKFFVARAL